MELKEFTSVAMVDEAIEKRNAEMETIKVEKEQRSAEFETADVAGKEAIADELEQKNERFKALQGEVAELTELRTKLAEAENRFNLASQLEEKKVEERKKTMATEEKKTVEEIRSSAEYLKLYADGIKGGDMTAFNEYAERAGITTSTTGAPVPTLMQGYVETAWEKYGKFSRIVRNISVRGLFQVAIEKTSDNAVWHDEGDDMPTEESITLGTVLLTPKMIKKWISMTDEVVALVPEEFVRYIADEVVYKVVKLLDDAIISGTGSGGKGVVGIVNDANGLITKVNTALGFNTHNELIANLNVFDNLTIAMNPQTFFKNVMGMTDEAGRPIYTIVTDNTGRPRHFLGGYPVEFTNALKAYDSASANDPFMVVGDFTGYTLNRPNSQNVDILLDELTLAREDKIYYLGKLLAAGAVTKPKYFAVATKASA